MLYGVGLADPREVDSAEPTDAWVRHCERLGEWDYLRRSGWVASVERKAQRPVPGVDYSDGVDADEAHMIAEHWGGELNPGRHSFDRPQDQGPVWGVQVVHMGIVPSWGAYTYVHKQTGAVSFGSRPYPEYLATVQEKEHEMSECVDSGWRPSGELP